MKRSLVLAGVLAVLAAGVVACSDETAGQPTAVTTTQQQTTGPEPSRIPFPSGTVTSQPTETTGGGTSPLTGKDPCEVAAPVRSRLNAGNGTASELVGVPHCRFQSTDFALDVALYPENGLGDYQGSAKQIAVGGHQGLRAQGSLGVCTVAIGITDASRVEVSATKSDGSDSCDLAMQAATALEPSLPR